MARVRIFMATLGIALAATLAWPAPAAAPAMALLTRIEPGNWALDESGGDARTSLCVRDPRVLLQLRHPRGQCATRTITDRPDELTVTYSCGAAGYGRTTLRYETPRLIQIDTQGIIDGGPFADRWEARRTGGC